MKNFNCKYFFIFLVLVVLFLCGCENKASHVENTEMPTSVFSATSTFNAPTPTGVPTGDSTPTSTADNVTSPLNTEFTTTAPTKTQQTNVSTPTPTMTPVVGTLEDVKPVFSLKGGFYYGKPSVSVSLSAKDIAVLKNNGISKYSIKLSYSQEEPTFNSKTYTNQITLPLNENSYDPVSDFTTSILRAAVFDKNGKLIGKIETATYIQSHRSENVTLPVISLVTNDSNLYDYQTGIIPNYSQRGSEWERPIHVEMFEKGNMVLSQDAGIRIFGGSSRSLSQKSFRITARKSSYFNETKYDGAGKFKYALFPGRQKADGTELAVYDSFVLRNGGNDSIVNTGAQNERTSMIRDGLSALIANSSCNNLDVMAYRPVIVMLNGQYYGILNMREHENENYIANVYGIEDKENITVISSELDTERGTRYDGKWFYYKQDEGPSGELDKFLKVLRDIKAGKYTYEQASKIIDMDNFIEYCAINIFICNTDWPHNNVRVWKYSNGKYKFMLRDADLGMARYTIASSSYSMPSELYTKAEAQNLRYLLWPCLTSSQRNKLYNPNGLPYIDAGTYPDPLYIQSLLNFCLKDDGFRTKFVSFCEKLATVLWKPEHLISLLYERRSVIEVEMQYNFARWSEYTSGAYYQYWFETTIGGSMVQWMNQRSGANGYFLREIYAVCNTY